MPYGSAPENEVFYRSMEDTTVPAYMDDHFQFVTQAVEYGTPIFAFTLLFDETLRSPAFGRLWASVQANARTCEFLHP